MVSEVNENGLFIAPATPQPEVLLTPNIGVIGVGGAGGNAVNNMIQSNLTGVSFFAANTDAQALAKSLVADKIQLGVALTKGLGAGANPEVGKAAAEESIDKIREILTGLHLLFLTAGMGGGTGTGAAPVIAKVAKEMNIMTVGVVSKPFNFEGARRMKTAETGIIELQKYIDTLIVIPNQNLFRIDDGTMTFANGFKIADNVLCQGIRSITDLIMNTGLVNHDFADVQAVLSTKGRCVLGAGEASGENRAKIAAEQAMSNQLLDNSSIAGAKSLLLNVSSGDDTTMAEVDMAAELIREQVDPNANIIFGYNLNEELRGKVRVSLVATGIDDFANPSDPIIVKEPVIPETKVEEVPVEKEVEPETLATSEEETPTQEPELIHVAPTPIQVDSLIPDIPVETYQSDLMINLTETPELSEPALIDEPKPDFVGITPIQEVPEQRADIPVETKAEIENVKPVSTSSWLDKLFPRQSKKRPVKQAAKKEEKEPSFLDGLDEFEDNIDLPRCLIDPRR